MPEVRRCNNDGVEILLGVHHFIKVRISVYLVAVLAEDADAVLAAVIPDVANCLELDVRNANGGFKKHAPLCAGSHYGDINRVATGTLRYRRCAVQYEAGARYQAGAQEVSTRDGAFRVGHFSFSCPIL